MKNSITILVCALLSMFTLSSMAQTIEVLPQYGVQWGGGIEVDLNNNGALDLLYGGIGREKHFLKDAEGNEVETEFFTWMFMFNPTTKKYEIKPTNIQNSDRAHFIPVDFNGDGNMDILASEHARTALYGGGIYEGKGDGTFEKKTLTFSDPAYRFRPVAVAAADFNNDARLDIVAIGYEDVAGVVTYSSAVLINKGNYNFEVTNTELLQEYKLALATVKVLDHNNDGYMDFFISANCDNPEKNGGARVLADIFENLGREAPGEFFRLNLGTGTILQKANGGLDIADFNADGWLDFAIHGEGGAGTGEPTSGDIWASISHVYLNSKNGSYQEKVQPNFLKDLRPLNSNGMSTRTIDWNGDGHYDLFIPGWNPTPESGTQAGYLLLNNGTATFGTPTRVPGASETIVLFPDWNGDGIRDYFITGYSIDPMFYKTEEERGKTAAVMNNPRTVANERPAAPANPQATVTNNVVTLSWGAATDKETPAAALSYEYFIKDSSGKLYTSTRSFVGGNRDGVRKVVDLGNAMLNKTIRLSNLLPGTYQWGVQAIDASYDGSVFASGPAFTVTQTGLENNLESYFNIVYKKNAFTINSEKSANIEVFAPNGLLIASATDVQQYTSVLPRGVYLVKITIERKSAIRKVVVN